MMPAMRTGAAVLATAFGLAAAAPLHADEWTLIDVRTRLANDGRATVVETHDIVLETTGRNVFRDFGRGADQDIRLTAMTRIGPDHEPHALKKVAAVDGPDQFAYYQLGHAYFSIPALGERVTLQYRFEYELIGAVAPAWAIAAGPGSRAPRDQELFWPWQRIGHIVADWRRARPAVAARYRFDHDVLFPDREGSGHVFRQIDYRLEYDTLWRDIAPETDIGGPSHGGFRTARVFDYLGPSPPAHATSGPAAMRIASLAAVPILGLAGWGLVVAAARARRGPPIDRTFVDTRFLTRSPEEIAGALEGTRPAVADVLARLAGEAAIAIHVDRPAGHTFDRDGDAPMRLHMRRVAADAALTGFERAVLDDIFGDARELTSESHRLRHAGRAYDPAAAIERLLHAANTGKAGGVSAAGATTAGRRWSPARAGLLLVFALGIIGVFRYAGPLFDVLPVLGIWAFFTIGLVNGWARGWWYPGRPLRGLLLPLVLLYAMQAAALLMTNRPLPAEGWAAAAMAALAGYFLTLVRSRMPVGDGGAAGDLLRMRAFAQGELERPRPQLDDRWIPRLRALGLGSAIEDWRNRHSGAAAMPPEMDARPSITTAHFTGRSPGPWVGPDGWSESLIVSEDDEDEDAADDEDEHDPAHEQDPAHERDPADADAQADADAPIDAGADARADAGAIRRKDPHR